VLSIVSSEPNFEVSSGSPQFLENGDFADKWLL